MTKKYTYLVHIALFLATMILLCLGFFLENPNGGLITEQRAMPTCKEVQEVAEETRSDAAAPQGVTREFHFTLDNNLTEKQLMFYVINSNTKVYINGELVSHRNQQSQCHGLLLGQSDTASCRQRKGSHRRAAAAVCRNCQTCCDVL